MMSLPTVIGIALGVSLITTFSAKNRDSSLARRGLVFIRNLSVALIALLAVNFVIFASQ